MNITRCKQKNGISRPFAFELVRKDAMPTVATEARESSCVGCGPRADFRTQSPNLIMKLVKLKYKLENQKVEPGFRLLKAYLGNKTL